MIQTIIFTFSALNFGYASPIQSSTDSEVNFIDKSNYLPRVTKKREISGGKYSEPFIVSVPNSEYVLNSDLIADGSAIQIKASNVLIDLNGKTIIYNQSKPGDGVAISAWNLKNIAIVNGTIVQGAAMSEGNETGVGNNPLRTSPYTVDRLYIADLHVVYSGKDVAGIITSATNSLFENNIIEDKYAIGDIKNRHQGVDALTGTWGMSVATNNIIRNNQIVNARHRGIFAGAYDVITDNKISVNSLATNSFGILVYARKNIKIANNQITAVGEHPIGIGAVSKGTDNIEIYNNTISVQTTKLGNEYGGDPKCQNPATSCGNYAVGFRTTWGGNNISFHDNEITVRTDSSYKGTYSTTGKPVVVNAKGRGLMVGINETETSRFYNNTITVIDKDGSGKAFGIACNGGNAGELIFENNTVASNILNVALGDEYGACGGYPLFIHNTFNKVDNYSAYRTVASELYGYFEGTGRFVSNTYRNGAAPESIKINPDNESKTKKSVFFGRELFVQLATIDAPLSGAELMLRNGGVPFDSTATTNEDGKARLVLYNYELHNRDSTTEQTRSLAPHVIQVKAGAVTLTTKPDTSPLAWDSLKATGTSELPLYADKALEPSGKLIIRY